MRKGRVGRGSFPKGLGGIGGEADVSRIDVQQHKAGQAAKLGENKFNLRPMVAELFAFFGVPLLPHFIGKRRGRIDRIGGDEIQQERRIHDGHFDCKQFIVGSDESRNGVPGYVLDPGSCQRLVHSPLADE